jgi:hypothetical protein
MNEHGHLSEDVLLNAIYGIADRDAEAHLRACPECTGRIEEWRQRGAAARSDEASDEFFAGQRRRIYQRIEQPSRRLWWWAPALAATGALAVGIFLYQPHHETAPQAGPEVSDTQLFNDIYSMERTMEPSATAPVHALFEDQAQ